MITDILTYFGGALLVPLALQAPILHKNENKKKMLLQFAVLDFVLSLALLIVTALLVILDLATLWTYIVCVVALYGIVQIVVLRAIGKKNNSMHLGHKLLLTQLYTVALLANQIVRVLLVMGVI